jgi:segregation and condensation protein B
MRGESQVMDGEEGNSSGSKPALSVKSQIESLLFVANEPVPIDRLAQVLQVDPGEIEEAVQCLADEYAQRGLRLQRKRQRVQMVTAPETADQIRQFLGLELSGRLSPAAMETLAIIAYRQPITRAQIESIRGVSSDSVLRTLLNRGLVEEQGRLEQAGRPIIYGTTFEFLQQFGLPTLAQLPPLEIPDMAEQPSSPPEP